METSNLKLISKQSHELNPDCILSIPGTDKYLSSFYTLNSETNTHVGQIHLNSYEKNLQEVKTPGIFDMDLLNDHQFIAGDVEKGLSLWNIDQGKDEITQVFRTELDQKIIYVDHHDVAIEGVDQTNVAVTMEQGFTTYLQLDTEAGEFKQLNQWNDATNTIWACKLLKDGTTLASGGDFGKYYFYDLRTNLKSLVNTQ